MIKKESDMTSENEMNTGEVFFCERCNRQLTTVNEISAKICDECSEAIEAASSTSEFFCKICGKKLKEMRVIAQGLCDNCKASIIRKLK